jgi:hypothetical protein
MKQYQNPKPWRVRLILVFFGAVVVAMGFYAIERDRWSITDTNPPPAIAGIEPTLWVTLMGLFLVFVGICPWEPFGARRGKTKGKSKRKAARRTKNFAASPRRIAHAGRVRRAVT